MKHIMLDLETLGTVADAAIMSIGAVKFDLDSDRIDDGGFYASVSIESNLEARPPRRIQEDTLIWWLNQAPEAQGVFNEGKQTLKVAIAELADWIDTDDYTVWSNGADFDIPMLAHAYVQHQQEVPWKFFNVRCFRTYKTLPHARQVKFVASGVKHNALTDAHNQALHLQAIQRVVSGREPFKMNSMVKA
jgi:3' exoribonuclease, RNase T-like